jgi:hypothetical protein
MTNCSLSWEINSLKKPLFLFSFITPSLPTQSVNLVPLLFGPCLVMIIHPRAGVLSRGRDSSITQVPHQIAPAMHPAGATTATFTNWAFSLNLLALLISLGSNTLTWYVNFFLYRSLVRSILLKQFGFVFTMKNSSRKW